MYLLRGMDIDGWFPFVAFDLFSSSHSEARANRHSSPRRLQTGLERGGDGEEVHRHHRGVHPDKRLEGARLAVPHTYSTL